MISLSGITTYFLSFGLPTRDPRIKASAPIAGGDPPYAALSFGLGFNGVVPAPVSTPVLLLVGDADIFEAQTAGPAAAYARLLPPRHQVMIRGAPHVWFGDRDHVPADDVNPDCLWFEENAGGQPPQCAERRPLIDPARQKAIIAPRPAGVLRRLPEGRRRRPRTPRGHRRNLRRGHAPPGARRPLSPGIRNHSVGQSTPWLFVPSAPAGIGPMPL